MSDIPQLSSKAPGVRTRCLIHSFIARSQVLIRVSYFVKLGTPSDKDQYAGEAESLKAIYRYYSRVLRASSQNTKDISSLSSTAAGILAKRMATELHSGKSAPAQGFGFEIPTYCGATKLSNGWFKRWRNAMLHGRNLLVQLERKGHMRKSLLGELMPSDAFYSDQSSDWMNKDRWTYIPSFCTGICGYG
ncbi:hypothetical protein CPB84DRAFT_1760338 [Gymnopilus junonius]|uniref:Uncharacterized protein n=1 Tax=Gymnopilus junonius TaxID=109634 RepID=A0A9P5P0N5_GYMJU|nr:hypothetical protein CPB84DRAFT_1760338 [Gymnopilus junonius]